MNRRLFNFKEVIRAELKNGKIAAIKKARELAHTDLADAKLFIEALAETTSDFAIATVIVPGRDREEVMSNCQKIKDLGFSVKELME